MYMKKLIATYENGMEDYKYVTNDDIEGLEAGFIDIHEFMDTEYFIEENNLSDDICIEEWEYVDLEEDEIDII